MSSEDMNSSAEACHGRLTWYHPAGLSEQQQQVYDGITTGPRAGSRLSPLIDGQGRLHGPFNAMLVSPRLGLALQDVGTSIRYRTELTDRQREIAILLVAVAHRSDFEWLAHEAVGRAAGIADSEIEAIRSGAVAESFDDSERIVVELVHSLIETRDLDDDLFSRAVAVIGTAKVVEATILVGYYQLLSTNLRVFRVPLPDGATGQWSAL